MASTAERIEELKRKYRGVFDAMEREHIHLDEVFLQDDKLYVQGTSESKEAHARVTAALSAADPEWTRDVAMDIRAPGALMPHTGQTVVQTSEEFSLGDDTGESI